MGFVIIADGAVDQIVETKALADKEAKDLRAMGCSVKVRKFATMAEAQAWADDRD